MIILKLIHKLIWWLPLATLSVFFKLIQVCLGWLLIAPFVKSDGHLPYPLRYIFEPDDTLAIGDEMFRTREMAGTSSYYRLAEAWGRRNPAYGYDSLVGCPSDIVIIKSYGQDIDWGYDANENAVYTLGWQVIVAERGYWNLRCALLMPYPFRWVFPDRGFLCQFGWNLRGDVNFSKIRNLKIDIAGKSTVRNKV